MSSRLPLLPEASVLHSRAGEPVRDGTTPGFDRSQRTFGETQGLIDVIEIAIDPSHLVCPPGGRGEEGEGIEERFGEMERMDRTHCSVPPAAASCDWRFHVIRGPFCMGEKR